MIKKRGVKMDINIYYKDRPIGREEIKNYSIVSKSALQTINRVQARQQENEENGDEQK